MVRMLSLCLMPAACWADRAAGDGARQYAAVLLTGQGLSERSVDLLIDGLEPLGAGLVLDVGHVGQMLKP